MQLDCGRSDEVENSDILTQIQSPNDPFNCFVEDFDKVCKPCMLIFRSTLLTQQLSFLVAGYFDYQVVVGRCGSGGNLDCPGSTSHGNLCCELDLLPEF